MAREIPGWALSILERTHFDEMMNLLDAELARRKVRASFDGDAVMNVGDPPRKLRLQALARTVAELPQASWREAIVEQLDLVLGTGATVRGVDAMSYEKAAQHLLVRLVREAPKDVVSRRLGDDLHALLVAQPENEAIPVSRANAARWEVRDDALFAQALENLPREVRARVGGVSMKPDPRPRKVDDAWFYVQGASPLTAAHAMLAQARLAQKDLAEARGNMPAPPLGLLVTVPAVNLAFARPLDLLDDLLVLPWLIDATRSSRAEASPDERLSEGLFWVDAEGAFTQLPMRSEGENVTITFPAAFVARVLTPLVAEIDEWANQTNQKAPSLELHRSSPASAPLRVSYRTADGAWP